MKPDLKPTLELLGILGVIGSLIFVGYEVNQNSDIARSEAQHNVTADMIEISAMMANDGELAEIFETVLSEDLTLSELSVAHLLRVRFAYLGMLYLWESVYDSVQEGILPQSELQQISRGGFFDNNFFRDAWPVFRNSVNAEFAEYFETLEWNAAGT